MIRHYKLQIRVRITGWISNDEVREAHPGRPGARAAELRRGLPVVIMEAMALRRPVISTYVAGIPELVQPDVNGWLVPAGRSRWADRCCPELPYYYARRSKDDGAITRLQQSFSLTLLMWKQPN